MVVVRFAVRGLSAWMLAAATVLAARLLAPAPAHACSLPALPVLPGAEYAVDPAAWSGDQSPPTPFTEVAAFAWRRLDTVCSDGQCTTSHCGNRGEVELTFAPPSDDRVPQGELGYRIEWLDGDMPQSMQAVIGRRWALPPSLRILLDVGFDEVTSLDATVALVAIDRAGNESPASEPIRLTFSGCTKPPFGETCLREASGCAAAQGEGDVAGAVVVLLGVLLVRGWRVMRCDSCR